MICMYVYMIINAYMHMMYIWWRMYIISIIHMYNIYIEIHIAFISIVIFWVYDENVSQNCDSHLALRSRNLGEVCEYDSESAYEEYSPVRMLKLPTPGGKPSQPSAVNRNVFGRFLSNRILLVSWNPWYNYNYIRETQTQSHKISQLRST